MDDPLPLGVFKPDYQEAARRWQAFYAGEVLDRPIVCVTAPKDGAYLPAPITYHEKAYADLDQVVEKGLEIAAAVYWGGEAFPSFYPSLGPDEIAVFTGAELRWSPDSTETNWSVPYVEDWEAAFPVRILQDHPLWQRQLSLYRRAAEVFKGRVLLVTPDLHTNMDLLAAIRGPQRLAMDLLDVPELIDQAMTQARAVFRSLWSSINEAGKMHETGYCLESHAYYSPEGSATVQCDFSIMMSPKLFRRWVLPALEEEAEIVGHVVYHWDGPGALVHMPDLLASRGLQTLSYVPGAGNGEPVDNLEVLKAIQAGGKSIHVWGTPEACKRMHRELDPARVFYCTQTGSQKEADELLSWFRHYT